MTNETIPELPDWVKVLIDDARDEGYQAGFFTGKRVAYSDVKVYAAAREERSR